MMDECTCGKIPYQWARLVDPECKAVHHDETHGYHTADGEPVVKAQSSVDVVEALILNRDVKERRGYSYDAKLLTDAIAEIGRLAKELWSCPECAFTFDAVHVDEMSADYSCPACAELRLGAENTRLQEALITIAERLDDAGCQCDSSDEYVYICNLCTANDALAKRNP